jgi:hypothetical protein
MRGVILGPKTSQNGAFLHDLTAIDGAVRRSILYWDKVRVPTTWNFIHQESTPTMLEAEATGVLERPRHKIATNRGGTKIPNVGFLFHLVQGLDFLSAEEKEPGVWCLEQEGARLFLPTDMQTQGRGVQVDLDKLLPVPTDDVAIADILNFKQKRAAELAAFQSAMDGLYQMITSSRDEARAYEVARDRVQQAVADMFKAMNESIATKVIASCKVALNVGNIWSAAQLGTVSGALGPAINLATMATETPSVLKKLGPFAYVHQVIDELV